MKRFFRILLLPIDGVLALIIGVLGIIMASAARFRKEMNKKAIFIVPGADIQSIHQKFGTLNVYLQDDPHFFDEVYRFLWGKTNCRLKLRENFTVIERRIGGLFPFYGLSTFYFLLAWTVFFEKVSLIHARDPYLCGFLAFIVTRFSARPFCISIHADYDKRHELDPVNGAPKLFRSRSLARKLEIFILSKADLVMPIRDHLGKQIIHRGISPSKIRIIPHGIDLTAFLEPLDILKEKDLQQRLNIPTGKKIISFVGRLSKENYVYDIVDVVKRLSKSRDDFIMIMAGGGNEEGNLRDIQKNHSGLLNNLLLPGFISHSDVVLLRRMSHINLVLMGGFSLIEACASGRPVVAYDVEWHGELVKDGDTGFLVEEGDIDRLVEVTIDLLEHPEKGAKLGEAARKLAFERHSLEKTEEIKRACYRELLERNRNR